MSAARLAHTQCLARAPVAAEHSSDRVHTRCVLKVRCSFGALGDVAADTINYAGYCFRPEVAATGLACSENTTVQCTVPASADSLTVPIGVSSNGDDVIGGAHFVPVAYPDETRGAFTYYVAPLVSVLLPPGGPVLGLTSVTVRGIGFARVLRTAHS